MKKRIIALCIIFSILCANVSFATISSIHADEYFNEASAYLDSYKVLSIALVAVNTPSTVGVSSLILQKKVDNEWINIGSITLPSPHENNNGTFGANVNCSNYINQAGTYRVKVQIYKIVSSDYTYYRYIYSFQQTYNN